MVQNPDPTQPGWSSVFAVPAIVARQLKSEPLLLTCIGVAALLTIIGIFGPDGGALYAWLLAGLAVVLGITWTLIRLRPVRGAGKADAGEAGGAARPGSGSNAFDVGDRSDVGDVDMRARADNVFRSGRRTRIERVNMEAGLSPEPERPAADGRQ